MTHPSKSPLYVDSAQPVPEPKRVPIEVEQAGTQAEVEAQAEAERAYRKYVVDHHGDLSDVQGFASTMWNAGYRVGGRAMFGAMREMSGVALTLRRIRVGVDQLLSAIEPEP